jgi:hypothetical protein
VLAVGKVEGWVVLTKHPARTKDCAPSEHHGAGADHPTGLTYMKDQEALLGARCSSEGGSYLELAKRQIKLGRLLVGPGF